MINFYHGDYYQTQWYIYKTLKILNLIWPHCQFIRWWWVCIILSQPLFWLRYARLSFSLLPSSVPILTKLRLRWSLILICPKPPPMFMNFAMFLAKISLIFSSNKAMLVFILDILSTYQFRKLSEWPKSSQTW